MRPLAEIARRGFTDRYVAVASPEALVSLLDQAEEVCSLRTALRSGGVTEAQVRSFVGELLAKLQRGRRFPYESTLVAVAVALLELGDDLADEFIDGLAGLDASELSLATRAARICARARRQRVPSSQQKTKEVSYPLPGKVEFMTATPPSTSKDHSQTREVA